jgi:hypothetical protein
MLITRMMILIAVLSLPAPGWAQELWGGTTIGMSVAQVKAKVPNTVAPQKPSSISGGAVELLRAEGIEIVGEPFIAKFYFHNQRLSQVTLAYARKGASFDSVIAIYQQLVPALRAKYGKEISNEASRGAMNSASTEWVSKRTNINLFALGIGSNPALLNVNYQVRLAKEADKL